MSRDIGDQRSLPRYLMDRYLHQSQDWLLWIHTDTFSTHLDGDALLGLAPAALGFAPAGAAPENSVRIGRGFSEDWEGF